MGYLGERTTMGVVEGVREEDLVSQGFIWVHYFSAEMSGIMSFLDHVFARGGGAWLVSAPRKAGAP